jgi:type VI secretion system protein ImpI/type VI secretion system protein
MTLTLNVLRCPDAVPPETKRLTGGELRIGRGADNDWIMPDPERMLSKKHCVIAYRNGGWAVADTSTNGTFLNRESEPIGQGQIRELADGDRLRFGAYEIEVQIAAEQAYGGFGGGGFAGKPGSPFDDPFGDDVFAPKAPPPDRFTASAFGEDPLFGGPPPQQSVTMPNRYDPLAPASDDDFFSAPTQPDHSSAFSDAFKPPLPAPKLIPDDDWDLGFPAQPAAATPPPPPAPPLASPVAPPVAAFAPPIQNFAPAPAPVIPAAPAATPFDEADFPAAAMPPARVQPPALPAPMPASVPAPDSEDLFAAFLAGAGITGTRPEHPADVMRALGAAFRASVAGIRQALIARASIKGEFRIEQTMIRARGNNPLKFSADDDDALGALLGLGRRVDMKPDAAIADALRDMRLHELATMVAMQNAVRALMTQLDPAKLRAEAEAAGRTLLPAQKKARAFEGYEKLYEGLSRALVDDFDSVFGQSFARAYEDALREISAKDMP